MLIQVAPIGKMNKYLLLLCILLAQTSYANMSSPILRGSMLSSAYSSKDIDILKEKIVITISEDFDTAKYDVEYIIKSDIEGKQMPLLFHAMNYSENFTVIVDGNPVSIISLPDKFKTFPDGAFSTFINSFNINAPDQDKRYSIAIGDKETYEFTPYDLKYFEVDLGKGEHTISVHYNAFPTVDKSDWIKSYSFHYSLSPAKQWRSFGTLDITVNNSALAKELTTNLSTPTSGNTKGIAHWSFNKLPDDFIVIGYKPQKNLLIRSIIAFGPAGFTIIFIILLSGLHIYFIKDYRRKNVQKKRSAVVIIGSMLISFAFFIFFLSSFSMIDAIIGQDASGRHGYVFLVIIFYPLIWGFYWLIMVSVDHMTRDKLLENS